MNEILKYLKNRGEEFDAEIAMATGISLAMVRQHLEEMASRGEVMTCISTRYVKGRKVEGMSCRLVGYIPPAAPGRKPKNHLKLS